MAVTLLSGRKEVIMLGAGDFVIANDGRSHGRIIAAWSGGTTAGTVDKAAFTLESGLVDGHVEWTEIEQGKMILAHRKGAKVLDLTKNPPRLW